MLVKFLSVFIFCYSFNILAATQSLDVMVKKTDITPTSNTEELFALNGFRQVVTNELVKGELDTEDFWKKIEIRNLSDKQEIELFKPLFTQFNVTAQVVGAEAPGSAIDQFQRATLAYDVDAAKLKTFFTEVLSDLPDPSIKTFYIVPDINIGTEMSWSDVGVTRKDNFSGVIIDSWKKWATTQFKSFTNVVILEKDFVIKPENLNPESVTLKWTSALKKGEVFQDRKSAQFELSAQYVLINSKSNQSLVAFDFPNQKREFGIYNQKDLSSNLASLIYNLLNSQTVKITSGLELNRATSTLATVDVKVVGQHGLFDITQINALLAEKFKDIALSSQLKSYASEASVISIKSTLPAESLYALFAKEGGKLPLNEQKILLFSSEHKTFAIISKEANN
jgi:hypothetical protein